MNQVWCASDQTLKHRTNQGCQKYNLWSKNSQEFLRERFCRLQEIRFGKGECQKFKLHLRLNEEDILARGHFSLCKLTTLRVQRWVGITLGYRTWDCIKVRWPKILLLNLKKNEIPYRIRRWSLVKELFTSTFACKNTQLDFINPSQ